MMKEKTKPQKQQINQLEQQLIELIEQLEPPTQSEQGRGRPRILPAMCLWAGLLVSVLRGAGSQLAIWRILTQKGLWDYPRYPVTDQAIYKRLDQGGTQFIQSMFRQISDLLQERIKPYIKNDLVPFAKSVVAIDTSTMDKITRKLPVLRKVKDGDLRLLPGKMAGIFDVRSQQWIHLQHIEKPNENDKVSVRAMLKCIEKDSMILADLGYFGFEWFDDLTSGGYYWLSRLRKKTSYEIRHAYYENENVFDGVIWLGAYRADKARYTVRLVRVRHGKVWREYITNVLDPEQLSIQEIVTLYARRWDIEMAFRLAKRELGLHLFWSSKTTVILQQVWAVMIISQILQAMRLEIASRAGVDLFEISIALMVQYIPQWSADGTDMIDFFVERGESAGFIRPSRRIQPKVPLIDDIDIHPLPFDFILERKPRYAHRDSRKK